MLSDPVFQMGIFGIVVGTIAVLLALRAQVGSHPVVVARGTRSALAIAVLGVLLVSGWSGWNALSGPKGSAPALSASSPLVSSSPSREPTAEPTLEPSPTPTPHLTRSITQVLTTFCQAINAKDQHGFTGATDERFTMGIEAQMWKITEVCHIISEGCFPLMWG